MNIRYIRAAAVAIALSGSAAIAGGGVSSDSSAGSQSYSGIQNGGDSVRSSTAIAPSSNSTAPCVVSTAIGIGAIGAGVAFGGGRIDDQCIAKADAALLRDLARMRSAGDPGFKAAVTHLYTNHETIRRSIIALGWVQKVQK